MQFLVVVAAAVVVVVIALVVGAGSPLRCHGLIITLGRTTPFLLEASHAGRRLVLADVADGDRSDPEGDVCDESSAETDAAEDPSWRNSRS
jgi:hypothetical protein